MDQNQAAVQTLIGALPGRSTQASTYAGGQDRWMQDSNVRQLLETLASQGTPTKGPEEFAEDPDLMVRLAQRYMSPERGQPIQSRVPGEPPTADAPDWDVGGVLQQLLGAQGRLRQPTPEPTPAPAAPPSTPGYDIQDPKDVLRDLLLRRQEPWLAR